MRHIDQGRSEVRPGVEEDATGPERPRLEERVQELGLEQAVTIEGALSPLEVREAMNRASIFCLPAVIAENGDRDSQPVVIKVSAAKS